MSTCYWGNAEGNLMLQQKLRDRLVWLALHTDEPTPAAITGTEVTGGGYTRQQVLWAPPAGLATVTANNLLFPGMPAVTVSWVSCWSDQFAGNMILAWQLSPAQVVPLGGEFLKTVGDLAIQL